MRTTFQLATTNQDYALATKLAERLHIVREDYQGGSFFTAIDKETEVLFESCLEAQDTSVLDELGY